jgi:serine/threonine protein kinase
MPLSAGDRLGRYEILAPIGAGGMGEVYRARDTELERDVAIKVLPEAVSKDPDRLARFHREAKTVARLSHPNILDIHDYGHDGSVAYSVTELLAGESLRQCLRRRSAPMSWQRVCALGAAVAEGLAAAHSKNIVHRDIKPGNIFLTADGRVKILDFGIARLEEPSTTGEGDTETLEGDLTDDDIVTGTVGYMAPEQVRGERADHRADIFSLGCVLYEMVCGRRAFSRDTVVETLSAILKDQPNDLRSLAGKPPPLFTRTVERCLEKRPEARFQTAQDLAFALGSAAEDGSGPVIGAPSDDKSIAVLPFANLSPDPDNEYFSDGLTEEIIADLARLRALRVISRTSSMRFKGSERDLRNVASELGVRYLLEGGVRKAGSSLRITAQLIDASSDTHLWAEKYTGTLDDVFDLQERISRRIADELEVSLTGDEGRGLARRPIPDPRAYDIWLRAKQAALTFTREDLEKGLRLTEDALEIVGDNALLLAMLGWLRVMQYSSRPGATEDLLEQAQAHVERALAVEAGDPWALFVKGLIQHRRGDLQGFVRSSQRSLEREPNSHVLSTLGAYLGDVGRSDAGRRYALQGMDLDPLSWLSVWAKGYLDLLDGHIEEALMRFREGAERLAPGEPWSAFFAGYAAIHAGDDDEAAARFSTAAAAGDQTWSFMGRVFLETMRGGREAAAAALQAAGSRPFVSKTGHASVMVASSLALGGDADGALDWLGRAVALGFSNCQYLSRTSSLLRPLHDNPRFEALLEIARQKERAFES